MPVDPNNSVSDFQYYAYYRYPAGSHGCPSSAGAFYVLRITQLDAMSGTDVSDQGVCPGAIGTSRVPSATQAVFYGFEA